MLLPLNIKRCQPASCSDLLPSENIIPVKADGSAVGEFLLKSDILKVAVLLVEGCQHLVASNVQADLLLA